ncbi:MAG: hypothetical protein GC160_17895 [Acidobacteria bacterium]|nr:hypothetical protein [Acidobacteriota bacterium]
MNPSEMDALVERIGDEILARLGRGPALATGPNLLSTSGPASWPRPQDGYAARLEAGAAGPGVTAGAVEAACGQAVELGLRAVWTAGSWTARALRVVGGSSVRLGAVTGFPYGDSPTAAKRVEAEVALSNGAAELLTSFDAGAWASGEWDRVYADLIGVGEVATSAGAAWGVAVEAAALDEAAVVKAAIAAKLAGAGAIYLGGWASHAAFGPARVGHVREAVGDEVAVGVWGEMAGFGAAAAWAAAGACRLSCPDPAAVLREAPRG